MVCVVEMAAHVIQFKKNFIHQKEKVSNYIMLIKILNEELSKLFQHLFLATLRWGLNFKILKDMC